MKVETTQVRRGRIGSLRLEVYPTAEQMGHAAAKATADELTRLGKIVTRFL